jgi:hypothetical protein
MSICIPIHFRSGRTNPDHLYIKIKNGAVLLYKQRLSTGQQALLKEQIKLNDGMTKRKHWIPIKNKQGDLLVKTLTYNKSFISPKQPIV